MSSSSSAEPHIAAEDLGGGIRVLTVVNPKKRNALDAALVASLHRALELAGREGVRVLILRGDGGHFCSGYDLSGLEEIPAEGPLPDEPLQAMLAALEGHPAVTIALVRGAAFGGGAELAVTCDLRLFGDDVTWSLPPARIGVVYAPEGLRRVAALVGPARARLLFFTGRRVDASEAWALGLCEEVHAASAVESKALALAQEIAGNAPLAIAGMKRAFHLLQQGPLDAAADAELARLRRQAFQSEDAREGRRALLEKRPPRFTGL